MAKSIPEKRKKRDVPAASLANLRPIKKGEIRNPLGAGAVSPALRALKNITVEVFQEILTLVLTGNRADLAALIADPATPNITVAVAKAFQKATEHGDYQMVEQLAQRLIGKVPDKLDVNSNSNVNASVAMLDRAQLKVLLAKIREDV